jgi:VWFA-related protein
VSVADRDGRFIYNLGKNDFRIYDNGIEQQVAYFASVEKPFTVVLMIDTSASTWEKLPEIRDAAVDFLDQLRPEDQVMILSFSKGVSIECQPTYDRQELRDAIRHVGKGSSTHLYDAMDRVMNRELPRFQGRKAIVLFTDGVDATSSRNDYEDNVRDAEELDALIYPIRYDTFNDQGYNSGYPVPSPQQWPRRRGGIILGIPWPGSIILGGGGSWPGGGSSPGGPGTSRDDYEHGREYLYDLAAKTGGRVFEATEDRYSMDVAFRSIAEELRHQYSIGYYPKGASQPGEQHRIRVKVNRPDVAVRARDTFIFNPIGGSPNTAQGNPQQTAPVLKRPLVSQVP